MKTFFKVSSVIGLVLVVDLMLPLPAQAQSASDSALEVALLIKQGDEALQKAVSQPDHAVFTTAVDAYTRAARLTPGDARLRYKLGTAYLTFSRYFVDPEKHYPGAVAAFTEAVRLQPNFVEAHAGLGAAHYGASKYAEAITAYGEAIRLRPDVPAHYYYRGVARAESKQDDLAVNDYTEAIRLEPAALDAYLSRGVAYSRLGQHANALKDAEVVLRLDANNATAYNNKGAALRLLGRYKEAEQSLREALRLNPKSSRPHFHLGALYLATGDRPAALEQLVNLQEFPTRDASTESSRDALATLLYQHPAPPSPSPQSLQSKSLGRAYFQRQKFEAAQIFFKEAIWLNPSDPEAYQLNGDAKAFAQIDYDLARYFNPVVHVEAAISAYTKALELDPAFAPAYHSRAWSYLLKREHAEASADASKYIQLKGTNDLAAPYMSLVRYFAARESKLPEREAVIHLPPSPRGSLATWPQPILRYLRDEITAEDLLALASDKDRMTQARTYIGMRLQLAGQKDQADTNFRWVSSNGTRTLFEYLLADAYLTPLWGFGGEFFKSLTQSPGPESVPSVQGTTWVGDPANENSDKYRFSEKGSLSHFRFKYNDEFMTWMPTITVGATWKQSGNIVEIEFKKSRIKATIKGDRMEGTETSEDGTSRPWSVTKVPAEKQ